MPDERLAPAEPSRGTGHGGDSLHRRPQCLGAVGDRRGHKGGGAVPGVEGGHAADGRFHLLPGGAVDLGAATSVDVHVDEPGAINMSPRSTAAAPGRGQPATDLAHGTSLDDDEAVLEEISCGVATRLAPEHVVRHTVV